MVDKLGLPFPLLSDPDGERAIKAYGVWNPDAAIAKPAVVVVGPDGGERFRQVGGDFADRITEEELLDAVGRLDLPGTSQPPPQPGTPEPGERAVDLSWLPAYYRGAKFAATAIKGRVPEAKGDADRLLAEYDRYLDALRWRRERR